MPSRIHSILAASCLLLFGLTACGPQLPTSSIEQSFSPHTRVLAAPTRDYQEVRWSPDGQVIAAIGWRIASYSLPIQSVLLLHPDGTLIREITTFPGQTNELILKTLAWRSDGMLAVVADLTSVSDRRRDPRPDRDALFLIDPRDSQHLPQLLRANLAPISSMDWSPDGQRLLLAQEQGPPVPMIKSRDDGLMVYELKTNTVRPWQFHDTYLQWPRWSPDGTQVTYVALTVPGRVAAEDQDIILHPWPAGSMQRISLVPDCGVFQPVWSPDGQRILYREVCTNLNGRRVDHLVIAFRAHPLQRTEVCDGKAFNMPSWAPNNQVLAITIEFGENHLLVCELPNTGMSS